METEFCHRYFRTGEVHVAENDTCNCLYSRKLIVPGMSIRVRSLASSLLMRLEAKQNVKFHWEEVVKSTRQLDSGIVVWTSGVTNEQPAEYRDHNVQGIVGCWVTIPNAGYNKPFKIAAEAPSAYMNFTPDGNEVHISGGFGWTGEYTDSSDVELLAKPVAEHFVNQINQYLGTTVKATDVDFCVRPSTPTGQPLLTTDGANDKLNIYISGSAKSGTTHAPVLSEYAIEQIDKNLANRLPDHKL